jgi:hypothetical protein
VTAPTTKPATNAHGPNTVRSAAAVCEPAVADAVVEVEPEGAEAEVAPVESVWLAFLALPVYGAAVTPVPFVHWEGLAAPVVNVISAH